jgi:hypothetical protein
MAIGHTQKRGIVRGAGPTVGIAQSKGIYRAIGNSNFYSTNVDVRIDRFSDFDPNPDLAQCGCPPGTEIGLGWAIQIGFSQLQGTTDPSHTPTVALLAGARTQTWQLLAATQNVVADLDLGVPAVLGKWYGVQLDLDAISASVHTRIVDGSTGSTLLDSVTSLLPFGPWDPAIDGQFDIEGFFGGEITAETTPGLAVVDNIDVSIPEPATMLLPLSALAIGAALRRDGGRSLNGRPL